MSEGGARIRVDGVSKSFRIPVGAPLTLKQRVLHPLQRAEWREFQALDDVSFEVADGEFFGIVGRNGCGKSTLLKLIAGIYSVDSGTMDVRGRIAPLIELGVGFNQELSARDNVYINGTLLGMTKRQLDQRFEEIVDFAELDGFMDLKLRNFSSGMVVRLAFAIAALAEADVLLADEVLAVGDERFQQKCFDVFRQRRAEGQTVVFVTHDMAAMQQFCDRALLLDEGRPVVLDDPRVVARAYSSINAGVSEEEALIAAGGRGEMELVDCKVNGLDHAEVRLDERVVVTGRWRARAAVRDVSLSFGLVDQFRRLTVRGSTSWFDVEVPSLREGDEVTVEFSFESRLSHGRFDVVMEAWSESSTRLLAMVDSAAVLETRSLADSGAIYEPHLSVTAVVEDAPQGS